MAGQEWSTWKGNALQVVKENALHSLVDIFYDPGNKEESVRYPGAEPFSYFFSIFGGVFATAGLGSLAVALVLNRRGQGNK